MTKRIHESYSFEDVAATINGQEVYAVAEGDDAFVIEPGADSGQMVIGADGSSMFSVASDRSANITIKLALSSPTHRLLLGYYQQQLDRSRKGFPFSLRDRHSNAGGSCVKCFIMGRPSQSFGTNAPTMEWRLTTGEWNSTLTVDR